jgi:hypothetical protein
VSTALTASAQDALRLQSGDEIGAARALEIRVLADGLDVDRTLDGCYERLLKRSVAWRFSTSPQTRRCLPRARTGGRPPGGPAGAAFSLSRSSSTWDICTTARGAPTRRERAIAADPANAKARFNLGNVLHDRSDYQAALILFRDAVALNPTFADAHFNLATTCEQLGLVKEAQRHWQRYLALDPTGEWAAIAREHLAGSSS